MAVCTVLYLGSLLLTAYGVALQEADERAAVENMTPDDLLRELNVAAAHPGLAQGWFADRWAALDTEGRRTWIVRNIDGLRELRLVAGENGFAGFGQNLAFYMAQLDEYGRD